MRSIALLLGILLSSVVGCSDDSNNSEKELDQQPPVITAPPSSGLDKNPGRPDTVRPSNPTD